MVAIGVSDLDPLTGWRRRRVARRRSSLADPTPVRSASPIVRHGVVAASAARRGRSLFVAAWRSAYYMVTLYQVHTTGRSDQTRAGRRDRGDGRGAVRRPAVAAAGRAARPRRGAVGAGVADGDGRHRRQPAGRPIHRGRGVGQLPGRARRARGGDPAGERRVTARTHRSTASPTCCTSAGCSACCWSAIRSTRCARD